MALDTTAATLDVTGVTGTTGSVKATSVFTNPGGALSAAEQVRGELIAFPTTLDPILWVELCTHSQMHLLA